MKLEFRRGEGTQYVVQVHRPDGVVVSLPGAAGKSVVPHDLAHAATERALEMPDGVFGSVAAGAMFGGMAVVSGRLRTDPRRRSDAVLRANTKARTITVAEVMTSLVHDVVEHDHRHDDLFARAEEAWGTVREDRHPFTAAQFRTAVADLRALSKRWVRTPVGEALAVDWPDQLVTSAKDAAPPRSGMRSHGTRRRSHRRGRR